MASILLKSHVSLYKLEPQLSQENSLKIEKLTNPPIIIQHLLNFNRRDGSLMRKYLSLNKE